jgi:hypothetical protein
MSINIAAIAKDFATWSSVAAAFGGGLIHKLYSVWKGAEAKLKADLAKAKADLEAAVKKV